MDIRKYSVEETGTLELLEANDDPMLGDDGKPMTITMYGPGSKTYAKAQAAQQNRMIDKLKRKGKTDQTAEAKGAEAAEFLASCTKEFSANIEYDGLEGDALFRAVYADTSIGFISDQIAKFIGDWSSFTKGSTPT